MYLEEKTTVQKNYKTSGHLVLQNRSGLKSQLEVLYPMSEVGTLWLFMKIILWSSEVFGM